MIKSTLCKKLSLGLLVAFAGACFLSLGNAEASVLYPGVGKKPPVTWKQPAETGKKTPSTDSKKDTSKSEERSTWKKSQNADSNIRVGLASGVVQASISSVNGMHVFGVDDNRDMGDFRSNIVANLSVVGNTIAVNGKNSNKSSLKFVPVVTGGQGKIKYNTTEYRGEIVATVVGNKLIIVNLLSLEDYVKGVLPSEMSPSWNMEALKAQAVAARTYALYTKNQKTHLGDGYDLCDSTHCQSYEGMSGESSSASAAVDATAGLVMTYDGRPIYAPYHASSGGVTENSEDVWGNNLPYLRSVKDDDSQSPYHNWSVKYSAAQVQKLLSAAGKNIGQLKSISLASPNGGANGTLSSGRAAGVKFVGSGQNVVLTSQQVRQIFGLKSSYFTVRTQRPATIPVQKTEKNKKNKGNTIDAAPAAMQDKELHVENSSVEVIFDGHGFGHGLGMSQYGAKAMADAGKKYDEILHHYYTGIDIVKRY